MASSGSYLLPLIVIGGYCSGSSLPQFVHRTHSVRCNAYQSTDNLDNLNWPSLEFHSLCNVQSMAKYLQCHASYSICLLNCGVQNWTQCSRWGQTKSKESGTINFPWSGHYLTSLCEFDRSFLMMKCWIPSALNSKVWRGLTSLFA